MTAQDLITQIRVDASEWLEMTEFPDAVVSGILANKVIALQDHIEYLQRRLEYARIK
jgi:hypothetical protein